MKKKKLALWAGIIGASCLFGAAIALLGVTGDARTIALVLWSVVIITVYAIVTMSDGRKTVAKIQEVNRLLTEEHDIEGYIAGLNRLLVEEKDNFQAQQILRINLTVAYIENRDHEKALAVLKEINPKRLNRQNAAFYWVNLGLCHFYLDQVEEGMRVVELQRKAFDEMRKVPQASPALAFLEIFENLHTGNREDAVALLETARVTWENERNAADFALVAEKCGVELLPLPEKSIETAEEGEED